MKTKSVVVEEMFSGSTQVSVYRPGRKEPHFVVVGARASDLDKRKLAEYMYGCDWSDRGSSGYITPELRCDYFLLSGERRKV